LEHSIAELEIINNMGIRGCIDADVEDNRLYVIGNGIKGIADHIDIKVSMSGCLYIYDISSAAAPLLLGKLLGLGNVRQIEVKNGIAFVVSREDGLFIIDTSDVAAPKVISRFDSVEFATGVDINGNFAYLSNRHNGVHIVDISDLKNPKHASIIKVGESQSVDVNGGYLCAGIWGAKEMVACDVSNPYQPKILKRMPVDGRGDGIFIRDNYCYAVTGHHARGIEKYDLSDPAFATGNGMEIFDISDPKAPKFVSRIKVNRFIAGFYDMWDVTVCGNYAFLSHTYNGIFVINISDPYYPVIAAHITLPLINGSLNNSPVGGIAVTGNYIYAAGILSDLHVVEAPGLAKPVEANGNYSEKAVIVPGESEWNEIRVKNVCGTLPEFKLYRPGGQVYSAVLTDDYIYAACGSSGIHILQNHGELRKAAEYATTGFAMDVKKHGDFLYVAEGYGGLSIWKVSDGLKLEFIGRYVKEYYTIRQVVIPEQGKHAILQVGSKWLHIVDIENPESPELAFWDTHFGGQTFSRLISGNLAEDRYVACVWHATGLYWYDVSGGPGPVYSGYSCPQSFLAFNGIVCTGRGVIITHDQGYVLPDIKAARDLSSLPHYGVKDFDLTGKPSVYENILYVSNRLNGTVTVLDISNLKEPRLQRCFRVDGNPDIIIRYKNRVAIPAGYQGLLVYTE
jgi:hypothetical protein